MFSLLRIVNPSSLLWNDASWLLRECPKLVEARHRIHSGGGEGVAPGVRLKGETADFSSGKLPVSS